MPLLLYRRVYTMKKKSSLGKARERAGLLFVLPSMTILTIFVFIPLITPRFYIRIPGPLTGGSADGGHPQAYRGGD